MHLSIRQAYGWDGPIGDPLGGPAYGKREMPVIAVALAAVSFVGAATSVAAIGMTFMAGVTMVGAALTVVGTLSGNKNLAMIGGIMTLGAGMAGGWGGADAAAEAASADASMAGTAVDTAALGPAVEGQTLGVGQTSPDLSNFGAESAVSEGTGLLNAPSEFTDLPHASAGEMASKVTPTDSIASSVDQAPTDAPLDPSSFKQTAFQTTEVNPVQNAFKTQDADMLKLADNGPSNTSQGLLNSGTGGQAQANDWTTMTAQNNFGQKLIPDPAGSGVMGYIDKFGKWVKNNKELANIGLNVAQGLLAGPSPAQQQIDFEKERYRRQQIMAQGKNVR